MGQIGRLDAVFRYPVKSMAGEAVTEAFVGYSGLMGDRHFAFVHKKPVKGFPWHTGRTQADLVLFKPRFRDGAAVARPAHIERSFAMTPGVNPLFPQRAASIST